MIRGFFGPLQGAETSLFDRHPAHLALAVAPRGRRFGAENGQSGLDGICARPAGLGLRQQRSDRQWFWVPLRATLASPRSVVTQPAASRPVCS